MHGSQKPGRDLCACLACDTCGSGFERGCASCCAECLPESVGRAQFDLQGRGLLLQDCTCHPLFRECRLQLRQRARPSAVACGAQAGSADYRLGARLRLQMTGRFRALTKPRLSARLLNPCSRLSGFVRQRAASSCAQMRATSRHRSRRRRQVARVVRRPRLGWRHACATGTDH